MGDDCTVLDCYQQCFLDPICRFIIEQTGLVRAGIHHNGHGSLPWKDAGPWAIPAELQQDCIFRYATLICVCSLASLEERRSMSGPQFGEWVNTCG